MRYSLCQAFLHVDITVITYFFNSSSYLFYFFFFNDPATTDNYTLSLHDALPIWRGRTPEEGNVEEDVEEEQGRGGGGEEEEEEKRRIGRAHV